MTASSCASNQRRGRHALGVLRPITDHCVPLLMLLQLFQLFNLSIKMAGVGDRLNAALETAKEKVSQQAGRSSHAMLTP